MEEGGGDDRSEFGAGNGGELEWSEACRELLRVKR
jgi:hypothetical protein